MYRCDSPVRNVSKLLSLLVLVLVLSVSGSAYESCRTNGNIHTDGSMDVNFEWSIRAENGYYYPADGDWSLYITGQAEDISVVNDEGDKVEYELRDTDGSYKNLWMSNSERISDSELYTFNVSYDLPRAASVYENKLNLDRSFFNFCKDENKLKLQLPKNVNLQNPSDNYNTQKNQLLIEDFQQENVKLQMTASTVISPTINYTDSIFNISSPKLYQDYILNQTGKAENELSSLNSYTGLPTPKSLQLDYGDPESDTLIEGAAGQYSNGEITIPVSRLTESRSHSFDTLIHELVHAYNDRESGSVSDWWWEEGIAEHVTQRIMWENGYTVSNFYHSEGKVNSTFSKCTFQRDFIQDWNPVDNSYSTLGACPANAENVIRERETLGYAYSRTIIDTMDQQEQRIVAKVQSRMYNLNVTFTENRIYRNNQVNFFASQAADKDFTEYLQRKGLETISWQEQWFAVKNANNTLQTYQSSTRFKIYKPQSKKLESVYQTFYSGKFNEAGDNAYQLKERLQEINQSYSQVIEAYTTQQTRIERLRSETKPDFYSEQSVLLNTSIEEMKNHDFQKALENIQQTETEVNSTYAKIQRYKKLNNTVSQKINSANILESLFVGGVKDKLHQSQKSYSNSELESAIRQAQSAEDKWKNIGNKVLFTISLLVLGLIIVGLAARRFELL